jgi:hypothetical protein
MINDDASQIIEYTECHCGNAIFISDSPKATVDVINLHNSTAKREDHIGFILDLGGIGGWFCLHCGSKHAESDKLTELFLDWIEKEE